MTFSSKKNYKRLQFTDMNDIIDDIVNNKVCNLLL